MTTPGAPPPKPYAYVKARDDSPKIIRFARIGLSLMLIPLSMSVFKDEYGRVPLLGDIDLAIHEFGHNLFHPFGIPFLGDTMVIAGGSLTQIAFPALFVGYFLFNKKHRDLHAAFMSLWWVAINILDVSIYAGDARAGKLILINGLTGQDEDSGHDFQYLFGHWGVMNKDTLYAGRMRTLAGMLVFISIVGSLWAAWKQKPKANQSFDEEERLGEALSS